MTKPTCTRISRHSFTSNRAFKHAAQIPPGWCWNSWMTKSSATGSLANTVAIAHPPHRISTKRSTSNSVNQGSWEKDVRSFKLSDALTGWLLKSVSQSWKRHAKEYSKLTQTSMMELFMKIVNGFQWLSFFTKSSIFDVWMTSECPSGNAYENTWMRIVHKKRPVKSLNHFRPALYFCSANQMTGFYMKCINGLKWTNLSKKTTVFFKHKFDKFFDYNIDD